jgi:hypothetical protein
MRAPSRNQVLLGRTFALVADFRVTDIAAKTSMGSAIIRPMLRGFMCLSLLCVSAFAADWTGLQQQSETKITSQMLGMPFESDKPPFVWAMSFSPDGRTLAFGVQFARKKKEPKVQSYLVLVQTARPSVVLAKFETPTHVELRHVATIVWSVDSKFLAVTPWTQDWEHAAIVDVDSGQLHVFPDRAGVPWCGSAVAVIPGPRLVLNCTLRNSNSVIRFLGVDGSAAPEWTFHGLVNLLQLSPDRNVLALDIPDLRDVTRPRHPHEVILLNIADRSEVRRWSLPEAQTYSGSFAAFGAEFCTVADPNFVSIHEIACRNVKTGEVTSKSMFPPGPVRLSAAGDRLIVSRSGEVMLPHWLFGTDLVFKGAQQGLSSALTGQSSVQWPEPWNDDVNFASAVSENGVNVAIAESAKLRVYRVAQ